MEVHHHSHSAPGHKKNWTHYIWEFLMLFLAVFCGFLAENFREHQIEHHREKQFMKSLLFDVREDSIELNEKIQKVLGTSRYQDSLIFYLYNNPPVNYLSDYFNNILATNAFPRYAVVFNDATAIQLKNSGNLRLIRKEGVARSILSYWKEQENVKTTLERFLIYRNRGRELEEELFVFSEGDLVEDHFIKASRKGVRVIQSNPVLWARYSNIVSHCRITTIQLAESLQKLLSRATQLISLLKEEYHLK